MQHATLQAQNETIQALRARIQQLEEMLAAVGAGGVSKLIPSVQADSVILSRDLTAAIISIINDSKTEHGDQLAREFWAIERLVEALGKEKPTDHQVEQLALRTCCCYYPSSDPAYSNIYAFNRHTMLEFARKLLEGGAVGTKTTERTGHQKQAGGQA